MTTTMSINKKEKEIKQNNIKLQLRRWKRSIN